MYKISLDNLNSLFSAIAEKQGLYLPVDTEAGAKFEGGRKAKSFPTDLTQCAARKTFSFPRPRILWILR